VEIGVKHQQLELQMRRRARNDDMKSLLRKTLLVGIASASFNNGTLACGPFFPMELTKARNETLYGLIEGNFYYEAGQLAAIPARLLSRDPRMGTGFGPERGNFRQQRVKLETLGYTESQVLQYEQARSAKDAEGAFAAAQGLPVAHQHYLAGAVAFNHQDYAGARAHFNQIVELADNGDRLLWAHYMLAKTEYREHGLSASAIASFNTLRELAYQGVADPHGLALSSLGDEALWQLKDIENSQRPFAIRFTDALALYGEQAAQERAWLEQARASGQSDYFYGNDVGQTSLLMLARRLMQNDDERMQVIDEPQVQQLLMSYLFSRSVEADAVAVEGTDAAYDSRWELQQISSNSAGMDQRFVRSVLLDELITAIERTNTMPTFADRAAAVLYRAGDFERAARFAALSESALAHWTRAKLALRSGDYDAATAAYAVAARSFPDESPWVQYGEENITSGICRVQAESATLALSRGDFVQALTLFHQAGDDFYNDMAHVADRVLTVEELQQYVDRNTTSSIIETDDSNLFRAPLPLDSRLRALLARRLMRTANYGAALQYFDVSSHRADAEQYAHAMTAAQNERGIAKAQLLHEAGVLAKQHGMELLGSELDPDFAVYEGSYVDERGASPAPLLTVPDELQRLQQSAVMPFRRFSYRYVATDLFEQAAALVPERSQAFAALLCHATNWMIHLDPARAQTLYRSYLDKGAYVAWGRAFGRGQGCEEPDFARAEALQNRQAREHRLQLLKQIFPYAATVAGVLVVAAVAILRRRNKAK
jgi:cellulose synthase operon protein C